MAPVDVTLRDSERRAELRLRIPQAYMVRGRDRSGGTLDSLNIETRLPDLAPASATPEVAGSPLSAEYERSFAELNNGIALYLSNDFVESDWTAGTPRSNWLNRLSADRNSARAVAFELANEDYSGLWFYRELSCPSSSDSAVRDTTRTQARECRDTYREHYLSKDEARPTVKIDCDVRHLPTLTYRLGCTAATTYRGFQITYVFRHSQLNRWSEFDTGIRQLLDGFAANVQPL
jgi:hypothetical protein